MHNMPFLHYIHRHKTIIYKHILTIMHYKDRIFIYLSCIFSKIVVSSSNTFYREFIVQLPLEFFFLTSTGH